MPIYFYNEYNFYHNAMQNALYQPVDGGGRRNEAKSIILQFSCTELFSNRRQELERTIRRRSALGVENFQHRKVDFAKDIAKSLTNRVRQAKCPTQPCPSTGTTKMTTFHFLTNSICRRMLK